ncbi:restriction endonuclease [Candidatus Poribacteria bacterium]|nr:restriction endonuclease [Candidatus Poribacteria bacterium]
MARVSQTRIQHFLQLGENAQTMTEQGRALEDLICYLFEKIPGISVTTRNRLNVFNTEEIDIAFWNEKDPRGLYFLPHIILVECKNWSVPVSSLEVSWFDTKLRNRGLTFGVLIAAKGITGNAEEQTGAHSIVAGALREQRQIVVITRQEIEAITDTSQIVRLFKEKLCELAVAGTVFS